MDVLHLSESMRSLKVEDARENFKSIFHEEKT